MAELQNNLISQISQLLELAKKRVVSTVNQTMVLTYFEIGRMIVEEEQKGQHRAEYGKELLKNVSKELTKRFGKGYSETNLKQFRTFFLTYSFQIRQTASDFLQNAENDDYTTEQTLSNVLDDEIGQTPSVLLDRETQSPAKTSSEQIQQTLSAELQNDENHVVTKGQTLSDELQSLDDQIITKNAKTSTRLTESSNQIQQTPSVTFKLSWSHYLKLMRISDINERNFYEIESFNNNWSVRELQRQYDSALYARLALSKNKDEVARLAQQGQIIEKPKDLIKDPYILEFLDLPELSKYSENDLEESLISKLEHFLLELGKGFTFVSRQERITFDEKHFHVDLVFYNRILRCFVLIDLIIGELKHQDIGQMQMYVNYFDREKRLEDENKTIGIILCQDKNNALVEYTLPENNEQIFASKYQMVLPSKEDFKKLLTN